MNTATLHVAGARALLLRHSVPERIREGQSSNPKADAAMERYAAGDDSAFGDVYDALAQRLYTFALRKAREVARAEDLVQQTLLQLHCARGRFIAGSWVTPWAFCILQRLLIDQARRKRIELLTKDGQEHREQPATGPGPEESASSRQQLEILFSRALAQLSAPQLEAFELVYYGQMSHAEAAELLGVTVASVKLRVQRANQAVRAVLNAANARGNQP